MKAFLVLVIAGILLVGCIQQPGSQQPGAQTQKQVEKQQVNDDQLPAIPKDEDEQPPAPPNDEVTTINTVKSASNDDNNIPSIPSDQSNSETASTSNPKEFVGLWRAFSSRLFYDNGGGGALGSGSGAPLEINADGTWQFSTSAGKWHVEDIAESDWKKWGSESYGPTRKMVLDGWNKDVADGSVEELNGRVDFFWVIYRVGPPTVGAPGQVQVKYGHAS